MPKLDRALQRQILTQLADVYPGFGNMRPSPGETTEDLTANLYYLWQHGLVDAKWTTMMDGTRHPGAPSITAAGMDFLADDGGLSAVLGIVTIKLHDDTIRKLLIQKVEDAPGDSSIKSKLVEKIKSMPAEALGKLTMDGLDKALSKAPNLLDLIGGLLS